MTQDASPQAGIENGQPTSGLDRALAVLDGRIAEMETGVEELTASNAETLREHVRLGARKRVLDIDLAMLGFDVVLLRNRVQYAQEAVDHEALAERGRALEESLRAASQEKHDVQQEMNRLLDDHGSVRRQVERLQSVLALLRAQQYDLVVFGVTVGLEDLDEETLVFVEEGAAEGVATEEGGQ